MNSATDNTKTGLLVVLCAAAVATAAYWVGLRGPFLMDDNLWVGPLRAWHEGQKDAADLLIGNTSWLTHRTLAAASLMANAVVTGVNPWGLKAGNLVLHLLIGVSSYVFLATTLRRDPALQAQRHLVAAIVAAIWLLHPLNASTVLYVVQRMAQVAALACICGMWAYVVLRARIEQEPTPKRWLVLFLSVCGFTAVGILGKQNAVVLPGLCLAIELAYFRPFKQWPRQLHFLFGTTILAPVLLVVGYLALHPSVFDRAYGEYDFTMAQRLLSEGRALVEYLRMTLIPLSPSMGLFTDDFAPSRGLLDPPATLWSWLGLSLLSLGAWRLRKIAPSLFAGWFIFLVGHSVEASFLPLELYYEHRNYLPGLGLILSCAAATGLLVARGSTYGIRANRIVPVLAIATLLMLTFQLHGRARVWSNASSLTRSAFLGHPASPRAAITYVGLTLQTKDFAAAQRAVDEVRAQSNSPRVLGVIDLFDIRVRCEAGIAVPPGQLGRAVARLPQHVDLTTALTIGHVWREMKVRGCKGLEPSDLADTAVLLADRSSQPIDAFPIAYLRNAAAEIYASDGEWDKALKQARLSWQPTTDASGALILVQALLHAGLPDEAEVVYKQAVERARPNHSSDRIGLAWLRRHLDEWHAAPRDRPRSKKPRN